MLARLGAGRAFGHAFPEVGRVARQPSSKQSKDNTHVHLSKWHTRPRLDAEVARYIGARKDEGRVRPAEPTRRRQRHAQVPAGRLRDERHARRRGQRRREVRRRRRQAIPERQYLCAINQCVGCTLFLDEARGEARSNV